jgi:hypothetical protein
MQQGLVFDPQPLKKKKSYKNSKSELEYCVATQSRVFCTFNLKINLKVCVVKLGVVA